MTSLEQRWEWKSIISCACGVHSNAEGLPATARAAPVRHAGHHLVLLLAAQQQIGWRLDLHSSIASYQSFGETMQRAAGFQHC